MKIKSILLAATALTVISLSSCMKDPMACVDNTTKTGTVGQAVTFDASCSMDAHHYEWDFGDGATGEGESVTHSYNTAGSYSVTFKAMSKNMKKEDMKMIMVTIN